MVGSIRIAEVVAYLAGVAGALQVVRACRVAANVEDGTQAEGQLRRGLRTMGAGLFAVITIDYVGSELVSAHQWSFVGYLTLYAAFVFAWGMPAIRRVQRARSARSWSRWPEKVPL